jgi:hypothetical protein
VRAGPSAPEEVGRLAGLFEVSRIAAAAMATIPATGAGSVGVMAEVVKAQLGHDAVMQLVGVAMS